MVAHAQVATRRLMGAAAGLIAAALAFTIAELLAALGAWASLVGTAASPFRSLGDAFIAITPGWLKDLAIGMFGQHDKTALAVAIVVVAVAAATGVGLILRAHRRWAIAGSVILLVVPAAAIVTRPHASAADLLPLVIGGVVGIGFLTRVGRRLAAPEPEESLEPSPETTRESTPQAIPDTTPEPGPTIRRRRVLRLTGYGAVAAVGAGVVARFVPETADIAADRAALVSPASRAPVVSPTLPALPSSIDPPVPGLTQYVTDPKKFYRVDTAFFLPRVATDDWHLTVHGLVEEPFTIGWSELVSLPQVTRWITLACVSNPVGGNLIGNAAWQGVRISDLLARARPKSGADCVLSTSADNFTVTTPLSALTDGRDALLAIGMNGQPLPVEHGYPVRMVVPGLYGFVSATKWVVDLEVTRFADATAFWTHRGWSARAPIKTSSRIDTPAHGATVPSGVVPIAGVAWAQHRGISEVQVQVDDGPWLRAELSGVANVDTWRQWVLRWDTTTVTPGEHTLRCRAVDGDGTMQIAGETPVVPDGATGYDAVPVVTT